MSKSCGYQGYEFGAGSYPDSICVSGRLFDADACDGEGNLFDPMEDIPCPMCRPEDAIAWWADRNSCFVDDDETEEETAARARDNAISLVTDIRKNRGVETGTLSTSIEAQP
jgi:hypothetical protein